MFNILNYMNPLSFFIAFCIGIFIVYISVPNPTIIYKYPTPDNVGKEIYKDDAGTCYSYSPIEVNCSEHKGNIKKTKIQHNQIKSNKKTSIFEDLKKKFTSV